MAGKPSDNPKGRVVHTRVDKATSEALDEIMEVTGADNASDIARLAIQAYRKQFPPYNVLNISFDEKIIELITRYATEKAITVNDFVVKAVKNELVKKEIGFDISTQGIETIKKMLEYIQLTKE